MCVTHLDNPATTWRVRGLIGFIGPKTITRFIRAFMLYPLPRSENLSTTRIWEDSYPGGLSWISSRARTSDYSSTSCRRQ
eukprot:scaffold207289_cov32-Prasinocladus_malaysianus.AAC.2